MKRSIVLVVLGVLGLFAATGLTLGALAIAGEGAGTVVHPHLAPAGTSSPTPEGEDSRTPSVSPSPDDRGGSTQAGDDHGGSTNSGSSNSGSGSSNSGSSGSGSSGSGSDDD